MSKVTIAINPSTATHCGGCRHLTHGEFLPARPRCRVFHKQLDDGRTIPGELRYGPKDGILRLDDCIKAEKKERRRCRARK